MSVAPNSTTTLILRSGKAASRRIANKRWPNTTRGQSLQSSAVTAYQRFFLCAAPSLYLSLTSNHFIIAITIITPHQFHWPAHKCIGASIDALIMLPYARIRIIAAMRAYIVTAVSAANHVYVADYAHGLILYMLALHFGSVLRDG